MASLPRALALAALLLLAIGLGGEPARSFAAESPVASNDADYVRRTAEQSPRQDRQRSWGAWWQLIAPWSYAIVVPLFVGSILAERAGRKTLQSVLLLSLVVLPTALALAPVLTAPPLPLARQAFPDTSEYADAARNLAALAGYVTTVHGGEPHPPRYPPGFSLALVPFSVLADYPAGAQIGAKLFAVAYVISATGTAWTIGGPLAGGLAATLVGLSPFARHSATTVMSDALAAGVTVALAALVHRHTREGVTLAGACGGALVAIRTSALTVLAALLLALPRPAWPRIVAAAIPSLVGLAAINWLLFGSPIKSGYDYWLPGLRAFDPAYALDYTTMRDGPLFPDLLGGAIMRWVCPCPPAGPQAALPSLLYYPAVLAGLYWVFSPPFATAPGLWQAWRLRSNPAARFTLWLLVLSLLFYSAYFYQAARFMAAPATLLAVYSAIWGARLADRAARRWLIATRGQLPRADARATPR